MNNKPQTEEALNNLIQARMKERDVVLAPMLQDAAIQYGCKLSDLCINEQVTQTGIKFWVERKPEIKDPRIKHYEELVEGLKFTNALTIAAIKGYSESNDDKLEMHLRGIRKHLKQILKQIEENNASSLCG